MRTRKRPPSKAKSAIAHAASLPKEIAELISTTTVRVPDHERFFAKQWNAMLPAVASMATKTSEGIFELEQSFFDCFMVRLRLEVPGRAGPKYEKFTPSDWVAQALVDAAESSLPELDVDDAVWPPNKPISEAWKRFPKSPVLRFGLPLGGTLEYMGTKGGLRPVFSSTFNHPRAELTIWINNKRERLPAITISITGEPVCGLVRPLGAFAESGEEKSTQEEAEAIWRSLSKAIAVFLKIEQPTRGRPSSDSGYWAAWFHYHEGLTWSEVAQKLCKEKHSHNAKCTDNYRKQAEQFWKREREKYRNRSPSDS